MANERSSGPMNIKQEWNEFEMIVKKVMPAKYHDLVDHKLFSYFVFGYPIVFLTGLVVAYYYFASPD